MPVKTLKDFINDLQNPDDGVRRSAAEKLGNSQEVLAVKPLCDALRDPARHVRWTAASALGRLGVKTPPVLKALIASLDDPDPNVRYYVTVSLDDLGDPRAVDPILRAIEKYNQPGLTGAIHNLPLSQNAVAPLVKALKKAITDWHQTEVDLQNDDALAHVYDPRKGAVAAFRRIQDPSAAPLLVDMLRELSDIQEFVRSARLAFEAIGPPALPHLVAAAKDPDPRGKDEILRSLGLLGTIQGLQQLIAEVKPTQAALLLDSTLDWFMIRDDQPGTRSVKKMGWAAAQLFLDLLRSTDAKVRQAAVRIISHARDRQATPYLLVTLRDEPDKGVKEHVIWGLQALADPTAIYVLIAELEGNHYHPAQMALIAIGNPARDALLAAKTQVRPVARERIDYVLEQMVKNKPILDQI